MINYSMKLLSRYAHINWALADQAMVSGVNFLTGILLARFLGLEEFGRFTLVWMVVLFVSSLQHALINSPMMSIGPKQTAEDAQGYFGTVFIHQVVFALLSALLIYFGTQFTTFLYPEWQLTGLALPLAGTVLIVQCQDFLRRYYFTKEKGGIAFFSDAIRYLGQLAALIWLFENFPKIGTADVLWCILVFAAVACTVGIIKLENISWNSAIILQVSIRNWNFSKWLLGSALMQWTTTSLFLITAGALLGVTAVGALKAAQNVMGITHVLFLGLENIIIPRSAKIYSDLGRSALVSYLVRTSLIFGALTCFVSLLAAVKPSLWLEMIYGNEYGEFGYILQWYAAIYLLIFLTIPLRTLLKTIEYTEGIFKAYLCTTAVSIILNIFFYFNTDIIVVVSGILLTNLTLVFFLGLLFYLHTKIYGTVRSTYNRNPHNNENFNYQFTHGLFSYIEKKEITYAILGDIADFPNIESDLDICTDYPEQFIKSVREYCDTKDLLLLQSVRHATGIRCDVAKIEGNGKILLFSGPDILIFPTWRIKRNIGLDYNHLLQSAIRDKTGLMVPSDKDQFIYYLIKKIDKGELLPKNCDYLSNIWNCDPQLIEQAVRDIWSPRNSETIIDAAKTGKWHDVASILENLQEELFRNSRYSNNRTVWTLKRLISRIRYPAGLYVSFLGPDGAGKSTVIERCTIDLAPVFRHTEYFHLRPKLLGYKKHETPVTDPHGKVPRNAVTSSVKIGFFLFDFLFGWMLKIWPKLVKSTLIVFDRYYHDILVDPIRYRYGGPTWLAQLAALIIPKPNLWILLDAPAEVLQSRVQEVSIEESHRQRQAYLNLFGKLNNAIVINADQKIDQVVSDVNKAVLQHMADRARKRFVN